MQPVSIRRNSLCLFNPLPLSQTSSTCKAFISVTHLPKPLTGFSVKGQPPWFFITCIQKNTSLGQTQPTFCVVLTPAWQGHFSGQNDMTTNLKSIHIPPSSSVQLIFSLCAINVSHFVHFPQTPNSSPTSLPYLSDSQQMSLPLISHAK